MGKFIIVIVFFAPTVFFAQVQDDDTLFYNSGMVRPCEIVSVSERTVHYIKTNSKGERVDSDISLGKLKYYVDYDSSGNLIADSRISKLKEKNPDNYYFVKKTDTVAVYPHNISLNPFSLFALGISFDVNFRFGPNLDFGVHFPFRVSTLFGNGLYFQSGIGMNYYAYNSKKSSIYVGFSGQFYLFEADGIFAAPVTIGFMQNITESLTFNGYIGAGPTFSSEEIISGIIPDVHVGIGYKFGTPIKTLNNRKVKMYY